ncbi:phosphoribosyltransferase [Xanthobacteraceae bacterium Astr-EGSB]|uniref:phosphoribosyltransferase n=1 Tax=Astrobacterium formosum TaxID=3069710 RepID=UPI0027B1D512|nr:phosphoribosyltransferase [Xanthobacteraceae bacterium Astr-EGSB]
MSATRPRHFTEPTTLCWQTLLPPGHPAGAAQPPYQYRYPARLRDGRILELPLRELPDGEHAVASLQPTHGAHTVVAALADGMAALAEGAEIVVGMPTLGLALAPLVAERLGHPNYVPLSYSRKYWYDDELSEPVHSITTPVPGKRVYVDPNLVPRLAGRKVALVDDTISSSSTVVAVARLMAKLGVSISAIVLAMSQGNVWQRKLAEELSPQAPALVKAVFACPLFRKVEDGWVAMPETLADI